MSITLLPENSVKLRFAKRGFGGQAWINGVSMNSLVRFSLRQEVDELWVDFRAVAGDVRIMDGLTRPSAEVAPSSSGGVATAERVVSCVSVVQYAPDAYIPAQPTGYHYEKEWVEASFSVLVNPPHVSLDVEWSDE